jgi:hypothetical protein
MFNFGRRVDDKGATMNWLIELIPVVIDDEVHPKVFSKIMELIWIHGSDEDRMQALKKINEVIEQLYQSGERLLWKNFEESEIDAVMKESLERIAETYTMNSMMH